VDQYRRQISECLVHFILLVVATGRRGSGAYWHDVHFSHLALKVQALK
jgi:hypothetical protein